MIIGDNILPWYYVLEILNAGGHRKVFQEISFRQNVSSRDVT